MLEQFLIAVSAGVLTLGGLELNLWWLPFVYALFKNTLVILTIVLVVATFLVFYRFQSFRTKIYDAIGEAIESGTLSKDAITKKWENIRKMSESDSKDENEKAVLEAEDILDTVLKYAKYSGETLEKRIQSVPDNQLNFKEDIIWAHGIKSRISSGEDSTLDKEDMGRAVYIFERALRELNIL